MLLRTHVFTLDAVVQQRRNLAAVQDVCMSNERVAEFAYSDIPKGSKGLDMVCEIDVMTIFEAVGQENVNALVQLLELGTGGVIQVFEFSEVTDADIEGVRRKEWVRAHQMEAEVIGTARDFLKTMLAYSLAHGMYDNTYTWIKLLCGLVELDANGVNQEGYFALPSLQSMENVIRSCISY